MEYYLRRDIDRAHSTRDGIVATKDATEPPEEKPRGRRGIFKKTPGISEQLVDTLKNKRLRIFFQDEARIGQKGRTCRRWFTRGERPPGIADQRDTFACIFGAVEPNTADAFALVLPEVNTEAMQICLDTFSKTIQPDEHVALFIDQAGWHTANDLECPDNITLMPLPPYSPEFDPVERVREFLEELFLSHRLHDDYDAIVNAACIAGNKMVAEPGRLTSPTWLPWQQRAAESR